jgi:hypothetical protein
MTSLLWLAGGLLFLLATVSDDMVNELTVIALVAIGFLVAVWFYESLAKRGRMPRPGSQPPVTDRARR